MSAFGSYWKNEILQECEIAKENGESVKEILKGLAEIIAYILEYWIK